MLRLADGQAADAVAGQVQRHQSVGGARPQVRVGAALHDAEQRLPRRRPPRIQAARERPLGAPGPGERALARRLASPRPWPAARCTRRAASGCRSRAGTGSRSARSGVRACVRAVDVRLEGDARLGDLAQLRQAHHLEAAGVGEDRSLPAHESVQAAQPGDALRARPQHQVVGVAEHDVGAGGFELVGVERLHRARPCPPA